MFLVASSPPNPPSLLSGPHLDFKVTTTSKLQKKLGKGGKATGHCRMEKYTV